MNAVACAANLSWLASSLPAWARFRRALGEPQQTQEGLLRRLIARHAESEFGRQHGLSEISTYAQYRERVPVLDYEALEPWLARIQRGEPRLLTDEPVTRLVPTSGSSGARKLIPFTDSLQKEFSAAISPWLVDLCCRHRRVPLGSAYWSISPLAAPRVDKASAVPIGFDDDSAYLGGLRRRLAMATFAVPPAVRLVGEVEEVRYLSALCLLRRPDLSFVSVWHPSFFTLLLDALPQFWDELLRDLECGGCRQASSLPAPLRTLATQRAQPLRAAALRRFGPGEPARLWPALRVISCWGDGQAGLALQELQQRLPGATLQAKGLLATEGCISLPFQGLHPLAVTSHFLEFEDAREQVWRAHELQRGQIYTVILTTGGGLWRYRLGDQVEVDDFCGRTPSVRFIGRAGKVVDLCGEKLTEGFVTRALEMACTRSGFAPRFAMLAPETPPAARPHYTLFVEGDATADFLQQFEMELRQNPHYALCRDLGQLALLQFHRISGHGYATFCRAQNSSQRQGEIKPQMLSPRVDWREHFS